MKLSTKGKYALIALVDIALQESEEPVTLAALSKRQDISITYLEQLFGKLRRFDLVSSKRGASGGYVLAKSPSEIRVSAILEAVDERINASEDGKGAKGAISGSRAQSLSNRVWQSLSASVYVHLHNTRLSDIIRNDLAPCPAVPLLYQIEDDDL